MLRIDTDGAIRTLVLSRPEAGNSLNLALVDALQCALDAAAADTGLRVLIVTGEGDKFFCAGGDVKEFSAIADEAALFDMLGPMERLFRTIGSIPVPVVAAVNGYALGAGAELALACDVRVLSENASIGFIQTRVGVLPTLYSLSRLRAICGDGVAADILLGARTLDAGNAERAGLCSRVAGLGGAYAASLEVARNAAANSGLAVAAAKQLLSSASPSRQETEAQMRRIYPALWFSPFHRDVEAAFAARSRREKS